VTVWPSLDVCGIIPLLVERRHECRSLSCARIATPEATSCRRRKLPDHRPGRNEFVSELTNAMKLVATKLASIESAEQQQTQILSELNQTMKDVRYSIKAQAGISFRNEP
jgi:hypothetical protein